jgi:hypothetical protein
MLELPVFVSVAACVPKLPTCTLPKFKVAGVTLNWSDELTPVPAREIVIGEFGALLVSIKVPLTEPAAVGANPTVKLELVPAPIVSGTVRPLMVKNEGETTAAVMVMLALPELFRVTVCEVLLPVVTLPKVTVEGEEESCP